MRKYQPKSEVNDIDPIAHQYNRYVKDYNQTLEKYDKVSKFPKKQLQRFKAKRFVTKLKELELKIDHLGIFLESEYD